MVSLWGLCVSVCLWGFSPCVHIFFLCLTLSLWSPVWSTSWQTPTCHIYCPAEASRPDLHQQSHQGKSSENQRLAVKNTLNKCKKKNNNLCEGVSVYLNRLIYLMCSHGGCHSDSDGWWHSKLSWSSPWFCRAVQWQGQEVRRRDRMDTLDWERTGAAEHRTKLPTWHAHTEQRDHNNQSYKSFNTWGALCPQTAVTSAVSPDHNLPLL